MAAIMKSLCLFFIILASSATLFAVADAWRFNVGGNGVWALNPQENYKTWAERNRFQVNDTLYFKYAKGSDSVQQVMKADFDGCNIRNPIKSFDDGETVFTLDRSGPFYFISGNEDLCKKGQKLIVVVLAIRNHTTVPISPAKPPSTVQPPKSPSPVSPLAPAKPPSMAQPPSTIQPPKSPSPVSPFAPAKTPSIAQPPKSHSPISPAKPPSKSQPPESSVPPVSPAHPPRSSSPVSPSPSDAPHPATPSPSPKSAPAASSHSPDQSPSPTSSPPEQTPPFSPSPSETTPTADNFTAPAPSPKKSASGKAVTSVMAMVLSVVFTVLMSA